MAYTAADLLIDTLHDWGVDVIFGLPGDGINGIMEALGTRQEKIRFIQVRHKEAAAFMACLLGTKPSQEALETCDALLLVGTSFPYIEFLPRPGQARAVQIDLDANRIGLRYPVEVGLVGDCRRTLRVLLPLLERAEDRTFLEKAQAGMAAWRKLLLEEHGAWPDRPMKPQVIAREGARQAVVGHGDRLGRLRDHHHLCGGWLEELHMGVLRGPLM